MTLSLNCKEAGDPVCTHTMTGETEEEVLANAKKHGIDLTVPQAQMNLGLDNKELEEKYGKERFM